MYDISIAPPRKPELVRYLEMLKDFNIKVLKPDDLVEGILILCGGPDIGIKPDRDTNELFWINDALSKNLPILGICRGMQILNYFFGGNVSDLSQQAEMIHCSHIESFKNDTGKTARPSNFHFVENIITRERFIVNSRHHQYCSTIALNFEVTHIDFDERDGVVVPEAFIDNEKNILGVQWHPERMEYGEPKDYNNYPINWLKWQKDKKII